MNLSFGMQQTLADGEINTLPNELLHILLRSIEAMDNPRLMGFVLFSQGYYFVMAAHIVQDHRFLQGFRKLDLSLKKFNLSFKSRLVHLVQACFAKGNDLRQF